MSASRRRGVGRLVRAAAVAALLAPSAAVPAAAGSASSVPTAAPATVQAAAELSVLRAPVVPRPVSAYTGAPEVLGSYVPQVSCDPVERPGTVALRDLLRRTYGANGGGITRACNAGVTEHSDGRAYDWMLDASDPDDARKASDFLGWLVGPDADGVPAGNARRLGVMYVIWDRQIWGSYNQRWKAYSGASPHTDHVHVSLTWDGAMGRTSFWRGRTAPGQDFGPCRVYVGEPAPRYVDRNPQPCSAPVTRPTTPVVPDPPSTSRSVGLVGDWDGDGGAQLGAYVDGVVHLRTGPSSTVSYRFGRPGDVPVVGDWDGDGKDSVGVFRDGVWHLRDEHSSGPAVRSFRYGSAGDTPVVGRWTGREGIGVVTRDARWLLRTATTPGGVDVERRFGRPGDVPLAGDWDGDGRAEPGVRRGADVFLRSSGAATATTRALAFGASGDQPVAGDFDRDGADSPGIRRGSLFAWRDDLRGGAATASLRFAPAG